MSGRSLYISYDGLLEPLGQSQIIPYLKRLASLDIEFHILSFEKPRDLARRDAVERLRAELDDADIRWVPLRYHKSPSLVATAWDVLYGSVRATWIVLRERIQVLHARSYVAALIGAIVKGVTRRPLIFDMRGFWPEERVEGGLWPADGRLFRMTKRVERALLRTSDAVVVLTRRAEELLSKPPYSAHLGREIPVAVVPCCTDVRRFTTAGNMANQDSLANTIVYAGSVGTWYLLDEMLDFFAFARHSDPALRLLILNRGEHELITRRIRDKGLSPADVAVRSAEFDDVPRYLQSALAGLYFIKPTFSKLGSSPTKLAEYLAAGLPVIVNAGIGDAGDLVLNDRLGVVVERFSNDEYRLKWAAFRSMVASDASIRARCREAASQHLSLEYGTVRYREVYEHVLATPLGRQPAARDTVVRHSDRQLQ